VLQQLAAQRGNIALADQGGARVM
jgi:hypothetical protein